MTELAGAAEGERPTVYLDPTSSQRWARTVVECVSCGQPVYRRAGSRQWIHGSTQLRYSNLGGPHLARPQPDALLRST